MSSFYGRDELAQVGFASVGENVLLSRKASVYGIGRIKLGGNVRIDDFCILSAGSDGIEIGNWIHIAAFSCLIGQSRIVLEDFSNISSRVSIYSSSDDFTGGAMTNPMVPDHFKNIRSEPVRVGRHVVIGSGSVVLPGAVIEEGAAIGALSLVRGTCESFGVYAGVPARRIGERGRKLLALEKMLLAERR